MTRVKTFNLANSPAIKKPGKGGANKSAKLAEQGQMKAFFHDDFWQPMDTLRDKTQLEELWSTGKAPWKVWA